MESDYLSNDTNLIHGEILKIRNMSKNWSDEISYLRNEYAQEQACAKKQELNRLNLQKRYEQRQNQLQNEVYKNVLIENDIKNLRSLTEDVCNVSVPTENTLRECSEDNSFVNSVTKELNEKHNDNLRKFEEIKQSTVCHLNNSEEDIIHKLSNYDGKLKQLDEDCLKFEDNIKHISDEIEFLKNIFDEHQKLNDVCYANVNKIQEEKYSLKMEVDNEQREVEKLEQEAEIKQRRLEQQLEHALNAFSDTTSETQKIEQDIDSLEEAEKYQKENNNSLLEKVETLKENIHNITGDIEHLKNVHCEKELALAEATKLLQNMLSTKSELLSTEKRIEEEQVVLKRIEQDITNAEEMARNSNLKVQELENTIQQLQNKSKMFDENINGELADIPLLLADLHNQTEGAMNYQEKLRSMEIETSKTKYDLNNKLNALVQETETYKQNESDSRKSMAKEISDIKMDFDKRTKLQMQENHEQEQVIQEEIEKCNKQMIDLTMLQANDDKELEDLVISFDNMSHEVKDIEIKQCIKIQPPAQTPSILRPTTSGIKNFNEISGNSAEGSGLAYEGYSKVRAKQQVEAKKRKKDISKKWN